jgi:hypothetical protein
MTVHGHHATAFPNWLQHTTLLVAYRRFRSRIPTKPGAGYGYSCPESAKYPGSCRAEILAVRIRYKDSVAILPRADGKLRDHRSLPSMVPPFLRMN